MAQEYDIQTMTEKIRVLRKTAEELKQISGGVQAVDRNADRILAGVRMLEMNISEVAEILSK